MPRLIDAERIVYSWIIDKDGEEHDGITLQSIIDKMPTVDAEPVKHGHWTNISVSVTGNSSAECSLCGTVVYDAFADVSRINYCPNCGTKMDEVREYV